MAVGGFMDLAGIFGDIAASGICLITGDIRDKIKLQTGLRRRIDEDGASTDPFFKHFKEIETAWSNTAKYGNRTKEVQLFLDALKEDAQLCNQLLMAGLNGNTDPKTVPLTFDSLYKKYGPFNEKTSRDVWDMLSGALALLVNYADPNLRTLLEAFKSLLAQNNPPPETDTLWDREGTVSVEGLAQFAYNYRKLEFQERPEYEELLK